MYRFIEELEALYYKSIDFRWGVWSAIVWFVVPYFILWLSGMDLFNRGPEAATALTVAIVFSLVGFAMTALISSEINK